MNKQIALSFLVLTLFAILAGGSYDSGEFVILLVMCIVLLIVYWAINAYTDSKTKEKMDSAKAQVDKEKFVECPGFEGPSRAAFYNKKDREMVLIFANSSEVCCQPVKAFNFTHFKKAGDDSAIFFDDEYKNLMAVLFTNPMVVTTVAYKDILSVSVQVDGVTVSSKSTTRTIGGALLGGALLGGAGAVVGGLSGDVKSKSKIKSIVIKFVIRDTKSPNFYVRVFDSTKEVEPNLVSDKIKMASDIQDTINVIIDQMDKEESKSAVTNTKSENQMGSVSAELRELAKLKEEGILSEEEFNQQKKKLLGM